MAGGCSVCGAPLIAPRPGDSDKGPLGCFNGHIPEPPPATAGSDGRPDAGADPEAVR